MENVVAESTKQKTAKLILVNINASYAMVTMKQGAKGVK